METVVWMHTFEYAIYLCSLPETPFPHLYLRQVIFILQVPVQCLLLCEGVLIFLTTSDLPTWFCERQHA